MSSPSTARKVLSWAVPRAWILGTALAVGVVAGVGCVVVLDVGLGTTRRSANSTTFALGTLLMGFGTVGWSGSIMAGRGIEEMQRHLDTGTGWTEADSRRAMTRIAGFGAGMMGGTVLSTVVLATVAGLIRSFV